MTYDVYASDSINNAHVKKSPTVLRMTLTLLRKDRYFDEQHATKLRHWRRQKATKSMTHHKDNDMTLFF
jgi:hypothetical protein